MRTEISCREKGQKLTWFWFSVRIQTEKSWPIDPFSFWNLKWEVSEKLPQVSIHWLAYDTILSFYNTISTIHLHIFFSFSSSSFINRDNWLGKPSTAQHFYTIYTNRHNSSSNISTRPPSPSFLQLQWQPSVHSDVAFWFFDVGSSYHVVAEVTKCRIVHPLTGMYSFSSAPIYMHEQSKHPYKTTKRDLNSP